MGAYLELLGAERDLRIEGTRVTFLLHKVEIDGGKVIIIVRHVVYTIHAMRCQMSKKNKVGGAKGQRLVD
jgi:hypothetical protein